MKKIFGLALYTLNILSFESAPRIETDLERAEWRISKLDYTASQKTKLGIIIEGEKCRCFETALDRRKRLDHNRSVCYNEFNFLLNDPVMPRERIIRLLHLMDYSKKFGLEFSSSLTDEVAEKAYNEKVLIDDSITRGQIVLAQRQIKTQLEDASARSKLNHQKK